MDFCKLFEAFNDASIMVVGDVMIDSYLWGKVDRISPEAPVPVLTYSKEEPRLGGAANVALNLLALGATPILCSMIGKDAYGSLFGKIMKKNGMTSEGIIADPTRSTTVKSRVISGSQQLLRIDKEDTTPLEGETEETFIESILTILSNRNISGIIFEDYDKGCITPKVIRQVTARANKCGIPVFVDPKRNNFKEYKNVTMFKPNFKEFCEGVDIKVSKEDYKGIYMASRYLHSSQKIEYIMVTLSESGIFLSGDKSYMTLPVKTKEIVDVSGAGDTVISTSALCYVSGLTMKQSAMLGNIAAGQVCSKVGVVPVDKAALLEEVLQLGIDPEPRV